MAENNGPLSTRLLEIDGIDVVSPPRANVVEHMKRHLGLEAAPAAAAHNDILVEEQLQAAVGARRLKVVAALWRQKCHFCCGVWEDTRRE